MLQGQSRLAMTLKNSRCKDSVSNKEIYFTSLTLDLLQMHFILSKPILILSRLIKSFDHEGWAVGEAVCANTSYTANKSVGVLGA